MEAEVLADLLRSIGADKVRVVSQSKVSCACPLARWTHPKGSDSHPSFVAFTEGKHGDPIYACQSCHDEGSIRELLLLLWTKGKDTYHWVEIIDAGSAARREDIVEATKRSERQLAAAAKGEVRGFHATAKVPPVVERESDGRPWYDYKCLAEADAVPEIPWSEYEPYVASAPAYALERGLTAETCREWELGDDKQAQRLLFPIRDRKGRLITISGRLYAVGCPRCGGGWLVRCESCERLEADHVEGDPCEFKATRPMCEKCGAGETPKYMHRKGFRRNLVLYGEHRHDETDGRVYVVEGHLDMLKLWQAGYRPVVAVLGTGVGEAQIEKLVARWARVVVVPDGDKAGVEMGVRVKRMVVGRIGVGIVTLPDGTDPGGMTVEELRTFLGEPPVRLA